MDLVSVASSVLGILAVAGKISTCLSAFIASTNDAPHLAKHIISEVDNLSLVLTCLQSIFEKQELQLQPRNSSKITIKQLADILAGCTVTFLELEREINGMGKLNNIGAIERIRWAWKEATVKTLSDRLGVHKATLDLLLTTLLCDSSFETEYLIREMKEQMGRLEETNQQLLALISSQVNCTQLQPEEDSELVSTRDFDFNSTLQNSHVCSCTLCSTDIPADSDSVLESVLRRSKYDTVFSQSTQLIPLAQVTSLSQIPLPICNGDIPRGSQWFKVPQNEPKISPGCNTCWRIALECRQPDSVLTQPPKPCEMIFHITSRSSDIQPNYQGKHYSGSSQFPSILGHDYSLYCLTPDDSMLNNPNPQLRPWRLLRNMFVLLYRLDNPESWARVQECVEVCRRDPDQCPILIVSRLGPADVHNNPYHGALLSYHENWATAKQCRLITADVSIPFNCSRIHDMIEWDFRFMAHEGNIPWLVPVGGWEAARDDLNEIVQEVRQCYGALKRLFKLPAQVVHMSLNPRVQDVSER